MHFSLGDSQQSPPPRSEAGPIQVGQLLPAAREKSTLHAEIFDRVKQQHPDWSDEQAERAALAELLDVLRAKRA